MTFSFRSAAVTLLALAPLAPIAAEEQVFLSGGGWETYAVPFDAAGTAPAGDLVRGCPGFSPERPSARVALASSGDLFLYGGGAAAFLAVRPDGLHVCETPDVYGLARFAFRGGAAGEWLVFALSPEAGAVAAGGLVVSGVELDTREAVRLTGVRVDPTLLPPLLSDLPPDPFAAPAFGEAEPPLAGETALALTLRGLVPAEEAGPGCAGLIDQTRPDARLTLAAPLPRLVIRAEADEADSTLMVIGPDGAVHCADDQIGWNPLTSIEPAGAGDYAIWAGVYPGGEGRAATLIFGTEIPEGAALTPGPEALEWSAPPAWGALDYAEGEAIELPLAISARVFASDYDGSCSGAIEPSRPDFTLSLSAPAALWIEARAAEADATLLVRAPDGAILCNDDFSGSDPALWIEAQEPGDYAVWVGAFGGGEGAEALLVLSPDGPEGGGAGGAPDEPDFNPFLGREIPSAAAALGILLEEPAFAALLAFERLEETGPEGFILHGVTLSDPGGAEEPIGIARIAVSDLDLQGLAAGGPPERFALSVEGVDYAALAAAAEGGGPPLPFFETPPPLSLSVSLLPPDGDSARRDFSIGLILEGQFGLGFAARLTWPEGAGALDPETLAEMARGEAVELRIDDFGFLGAALGRAAEETGMDPSDMIAEALTELEGALGAMGPFSEGSPRGRLLAALTERLTGLDRPGRIRIRLSAQEGVDAETAFGTLLEEEPDPALLSVEIAHEPL